MLGRSATCDDREVEARAVLAGAWMREVRILRGMSQEDVAHLAGVAVSTYSRMERGFTSGTWSNPVFSTIVRVLAALDVGMAELETFMVEGLSPSRADSTA